MNMTHRKLWLVFTAAALGVAACDNDNDRGPASVTRIVASEIAQNTRDDAAPILINDLPISDSNTRDDTDPAPIN